ncbi:hypothetical protein BDZ91DRAFT_728748 [Kalaharituber pfeilii]|nr:hypothetical protein BDZ91DRAFT_728748 [Kalaharituber pfeilii]
MTWRYASVPRAGLNCSELQVHVTGPPLLCLKTWHELVPRARIHGYSYISRPYLLLPGVTGSSTFWCNGLQEGRLQPVIDMGR